MNTAGRQSSSPAFVDYLERIGREHPDSYLAGETLFSLANGMRVDTVKYPHMVPLALLSCRALDLLLARPAGDLWGDMARSGLAPNRPIQKGSAVPTFAFRSIDSDSTVYTPTSMMGKYYLIDFWATWCGPCIGEMESLHDAYRKYHGRGFEILSISFDNSPSVVDKYRSGEWKMPWLHTFASGGFGSAAAQAFGVDGIPRTVLVGPDGKILAVDLRGEQLSSFLESTLR
jgi:thiol-disulfide isomerase/thioredoxin